MLNKLFVPIVLTGAIATAATSGVILHYEPTELTVGETVDLTISVSSTPGTDESTTSFAFEYEPDSPAWSALNPTAFEWINEEILEWFFVSALPDPVAVTFGSAQLPVPDGEIVRIAALTVTPTEVGEFELASNLTVTDLFGLPVTVDGDDPVTIVVTSGVCAPAGFTAPVAGVSFADGAWDGFIDARRESTDGATVIGLDTITIQFTTAMENNDGSPLNADAFTMNDSAGMPPAITGVDVNGQTVTLHLSGPLTPQAWTTIGVAARSQCAGESFDGAIDIGFLPADVDGNGCVNPLDLLRFKQLTSGVSTPPVGVVEDYIDTDRSGALTPLDVLAFKQLINGITPPATQPWAGACLPEQP